MKRPLVWTVSLLLLAAFTSAQVPPGAPKGGFSVTGKAAETINAEDLLRHIKKLSSDEFEGRGPGTKGEELSVKYLTDEFKGIGLKPGNPNGTYVQKVPLMGFTSTGTAAITAGGKPIALERNTDYVAISRRFVPEIDVDDSEMVFVGYGVVAPEYGWDDYKDVDVRGKTIVMLINDPAVPDPKDPSKLDASIFKGKAMTYYGRWTYKYEIASAKGAAAAIIVHDTGPAGYPFEVVTGSWGRENFDIQTPDKNAGRVGVEGWISNPKARELMTGAGQDLDALQKAAVRKDFKPVALNARAAFHLKNQLRPVDSQNVIAKLEGSDPAKKNEYVIYSAHWDHLGKDPNRQGDQIFNGALDNATGTASLLELAQAFSELKIKPPRSVVFLAVTAEEKGLLGSKYYANNPLYPLNKTLANINMDGANQWGRTKDILVVGYGNSTLDDILAAAAAMQNRTTGPEPEPEKGAFYRSDHFEFAKQGVPALYVRAGDTFVGKSSDYGKKKRDEYIANDYHKPSDEIKPDWDLSGAVEDLRLLFQVGWMVANANNWPTWKEGTEFKAIREESLSKAVSRTSVGDSGRASLAHASALPPTRPQARANGTIYQVPLSVQLEASVDGPVFDRRTFFRFDQPALSNRITLTAGEPPVGVYPNKYSYWVSAGTIVGEGRVVKWDLSGVRPGVYTAMVTVAFPGGEFGSASRRIEIAWLARPTRSDECFPGARVLNGSIVILDGTGLRDDAPVEPPPNVAPTVSLAPSVSKGYFGPGSNGTYGSVRQDNGRILLTAIGGDADGDLLLYTYSVTAGKLVSDGPVARWDLSGVEPGDHSVTVEVNDGSGALGFDTLKITLLDE